MGSEGSPGPLGEILLNTNMDRLKLPSYRYMPSTGHLRGPRDPRGLWGKGKRGQVEWTGVGHDFIEYKHGQPVAVAIQIYAAKGSFERMQRPKKADPMDLCCDTVMPNAKQCERCLTACTSPHKQGEGPMGCLWNTVEHLLPFAWPRGHKCHACCRRRR